VDIFFMPAITGEDQHYSGEVTIHYTRGDGTTGQLSVPVTADSTALPRPKLAVDLLNVDFGSVKLGLSKILTFTLTNTGNAPMTISPFTFGNGSTENNSPFAFPTYTQGTFTLQPGASEPINVIFRPYVAGPAQVAVTVTTDGGTQTVTLQGSGVAPTAPPSTSPPQPGCP
jgi:hypothetical protein